ncbi:hypothetical protein JCM10450v2_005963 [Rhodotorula kratochvilovae]
MGLAGALPSNPFLALPSLPLAPPNRPAALSSALYPDLVASPAWLQRFDLLQTLGEVDGAGGGPGAFTGRGHRVVRDAYGSTGCVNAMDWEGGPQGRLATGGDDTKICIWAPGLDSQLSTDGSSVVSPIPGYGLSETIATGHRANIFSIKWAPSMDTRLFSCAGDAQVRVFDLSLATNPRLNSTTVVPASDSPHRPWTHHEDASACTHVFRCHTDRVKRVATEASPDVFLTCAEDGTVRQHDLRTHHVCRRNRFEPADDAACPPPLAAYSGLSLYSLTISKLRPHLFVVAGTSPFAYLHDRRMLRAPMQRDWHLPPSALSPSSSSDLTQCVRRFGLSEADNPPHARSHIVAAKLSPTRPRDLLLSYAERGVYLVDTDGETFVRQEARSGSRRRREEEKGRSLSDEEAERTVRRLEAEEEAPASLSDEEAEEAVRAFEDEAAHEEWADAAAARARAKREREEAAPTEAEAPASPTAARASPKRAREEMDATGEERSAGSTTEDAAAAASTAGGSAAGEEADMEADDASGADSDEELLSGESETEDDDEDLDSDEDFELEASEGPFRREPRYHPEVPMVAPHKHYTGHANTQTVKDVNWLTPDVVISGSDDGNFFCWDRDTAQIKGIFKGDDDVVNVMQPHPRLPLVAISGIDETPKLFGPTSDAAAAARANLVGEAERIKRRNATGETGRHSRLGMGGITRDDLLQLLFARGATAFAPGGGGEGDGEGDEGEEGGGDGAPRPRRAVRIVMGGGAEGEEAQAVECVVS